MTKKPADGGEYSRLSVECERCIDPFTERLEPRGIALDVTYSYLTGLLSERPWMRIIRVLLNLGLPVYAPELESPDLLAGLTEFREHLGGQLTILLLREIGDPIEVHEIEVKRMSESVIALSQYAAVCSL